MPRLSETFVSSMRTNEKNKMEYNREGSEKARMETQDKDHTAVSGGWNS